MAGSSLQPGADQEEHNHRRSRLKIRRAPSSAALASCSSASFHGSCRQMRIKKGCTTANRASQPAIFHMFDPEVIVTEPAEFMSLVQRLTGSPATRKLLRVSMQKRKEMESSVHPMRSGESSVQQDPLKEGQTIILAPAAEISCSANADHRASTNDSPAASPNSSGLSKCTRHEPQLPSAINQANYGANPLAAPSSPFTKHLNLNANHPANHPPLSSISANSATYEENYSAYTSPTSSNSPLSPNSGLTTSSEGCFCMEEGGASSSCSEVLCCLGEGSTLSSEEDGGINFFVFSRDAYYGNHYTATQDELDQLLNFSNALDL